jgi:hypothetical protein
VNTANSMGGVPDVERLEIMLTVLGVLDTALEAKGPTTAYVEVLADLEVLDHRKLAQVAAAIAVESTWVIPPRAFRSQMRDRVQRRRLAAMVNGL